MSIKNYLSRRVSLIHIRDYSRRYGGMDHWTQQLADRHILRWPKDVRKIWAIRGCYPDWTE